MTTSYTGGLNFDGPSAGETANFSTLDARNVKISAHDHTGSGMGVQIAAGAIADGAVTTVKIADLAVTTGKIAADAVTGAKILLPNNTSLRARNAVSSADIDIIKVNTDDVVELPTVTKFGATQAITAAASNATISKNLVTLSNAGASALTINVPTAAKNGQPVLVTNIGAGTYTVTITGRPAASDVATIVQYGSMLLVPIETTTWAAIPGGGCSLA
jgi:hypothetical protein